MASIYDQHDAAFRNVSAFVVLKDGERVATIAIRHVSSVTAFVQWIGGEMVAGRANGGGYDRASAACGAAARKIKLDDREDKHRDDFGQAVTDRAAFVDALHDKDGRNWSRRLEDAGFTVLQAV